MLIGFKEKAKIVRRTVMAAMALDFSIVECL